MGNGGLPTKPNDVGSRSFVGVLGRTFIIVTAICAATLLLTVLVVAGVVVSPMIFWYVLRGEDVPAEATKPKKNEFVNLNIDQILGVVK